MVSLCLLQGERLLLVGRRMGREKGFPPHTWSSAGTFRDNRQGKEPVSLMIVQNDLVVISLGTIENGGKSLSFGFLRLHLVVNSCFFALCLKDLEMPGIGLDLAACKVSAITCIPFLHLPVPPSLPSYLPLFLFPFFPPPLPPSFLPFSFPSSSSLYSFPFHFFSSLSSFFRGQSTSSDGQWLLLASSGDYMGYQGSNQGQAHCKASAFPTSSHESGYDAGKSTKSSKGLKKTQSYTVSLA